MGGDDKQQAEHPLHLGACITDGKLHATVMRSEVDQSITIVATAELDVDVLELHARSETPSLADRAFSVYKAMLNAAAPTQQQGAGS